MARTKSSENVFSLTQGAEEFLSEKKSASRKPKTAPSAQKKDPAKKANARERYQNGELKAATIYLTPEAMKKLKLLGVEREQTYSEVIEDLIMGATL